MQRHGLILLTNVYPYDKGEEFLENEIGHLAEAFDRVVVIATQTKPGAQLTRPLPENVSAARAGGPRPRGRQAVITTAKGMVALGRDRFRAVGSLDPRCVAMDAQFEGRARGALAQLRPQLDALGLDKADDWVIYSYWFHVTARAAVLLVDELRRTRPEVRVRKLVSRGHGYDLYERRSPLGHLPMRAALLQRFSSVHPVSHDGSSHVRRSFPDFSDKVSTQPLGTADPGEQVSCSRSPFHVVSCSFVTPVKRLHRFAPVLAQLREEGIDVQWTHFGSGDLLDEVRTEAERLLGTDRVNFPGYVPNAKLADRYRDLRPSVLCNLSESEGLPVSIMEAAALAMPIVATDVGGVREIVRPGVNGFLLPGDFADADAVAALRELATMPDDRYTELCRGSRQVWEDNFDQAKVFPAWAELLRS